MEIKGYLSIPGRGRNHGLILMEYVVTNAVYHLSMSRFSGDNVQGVPFDGARPEEVSRKAMFVRKTNDSQYSVDQTNAKVGIFICVLNAWRGQKCLPELKSDQWTTTTVRHVGKHYL